MGKRTKIVLPSSDHVVVISEDVRDENRELEFVIRIYVGPGYTWLNIESEDNFIKIYNRLEELVHMGNVTDDDKGEPLGNDDIDDWFEDDWPHDSDGDYYNYPSFYAYWVDAQHVMHDVKVEHIGEVNAEESEDDSIYARE